MEWAGHVLSALLAMPGMCCVFTASTDAAVDVNCNEYAHLYAEDPQPVRVFATDVNLETDEPECSSH